MTRALLYARVSTDRQAEEDKTSLDTQLQDCRAYAEQHGWEVVYEITDDETGYTLNRPGMETARGLARDGRFDVLVAWTQARMSRSMDDTTELYRELRLAGVRVATVKEGQFEDTPIGKYLRQTHALVAELDRQARTEATSKGQRAKVESGKILGSSPRPGYGYRWVFHERSNGTRVKVGYEPEPGEAEIVRWLFQQTVVGVTTRELARQLNERGVATPYGTDRRYHTRGEWTSQAIRKLLRCDQYRGGGLALVNKRKPTKEGRRYSSIVRDESNAVRLSERVVPALVDADTWNRAQEVLSGRTLRPTHSTKSAEVWLRGGLVKCGVCGGNLVLAHKPGKSAYLKCTRSGREVTACQRPSPTITANKLQEAVWPLLRSVLCRPELLWDRFSSEEQAAHDEDELANMQTRLAGGQTRRTRLLRSLELLEDDADVADVRERLAELATDRDALTRGIAALQRRIESRVVERDRLRRLSSWLAEEEDRIDRMTTAERREAAIRLGMMVHIFPTTAEDRFVVNFGAVFPDEGSIFDLDWSDIEATPERMRETARLDAEAAIRGHGAELVEALLAGSDGERYSLI